jgi:hypothetical protein
VVTRLGRLLCWMRFHSWGRVRVIEGFNLRSVTLTQHQLDELERRWPAPEPPAWSPPWERLSPALTGVPVRLGDSAAMHGEVTADHYEMRCERPGCDAVERVETN